MIAWGRLRWPAYRLYQLAWAGLDWLYPPVCGGCNQPGSRWCTTCQTSIQRISLSGCQLCGIPQPSPGICPVCQASPPPYHALRSWAIYQGSLRKAIHRLKYEGDLALAEILSRPLIELLVLLCWPVDVIVPVPVGRERGRERGYNQAALLAYPIALYGKIHYQSRALLRIRETPTQVGLNPQQRKHNVSGAFAAQSNLVAGKNILVIDDVTTTGATMDACALALLSAGARSVYGLTLARAGLSQDPS